MSPLFGIPIIDQATRYNKIANFKSEIEWRITMFKKKSFNICSLLLLVAMCASIFISPASAASTRAIDIPTRYAPDSWYGVSHQWTAKYYTYSSYIFEYADVYGASGNYLEIVARAEKPFTLEIYDADNDSLISSSTATRSDMGYSTSAWFIEAMQPPFADSFYLILRNDSSSSISLDDNAFYTVTQHTKEF